MAGVEEDLSDDEIFFGKMTLKEVKKQIWLNHERSRTLTSRQPSTQKPDRKSIKIIETHSQPNLRSASVTSPSPPGSARDDRKSDESFIKMENLVSKLCLSPKEAAELELNNTLEIVDYILRSGPNQTPNKETLNKKADKEVLIDTKGINIEKNVQNDACEIETIKNMKIENKYLENSLPIKIEKTLSDNQMPIVNLKKELVSTSAEYSTPKAKIKMAVKNSPKYYTPAKSPQKQGDDFLTPSSKMLEAKTPVFKTPANTLSVKKPSAASLKSIPSTPLMYRHIKSPIASYIKGSGEVPMITNVCPKKPLPGGSMIPKLVKKIPENKENINLPTTAYKSAKKTKVVHAQDEKKPQSHVAKKMLSTLPHPPVILKHEIREFKSARKPLLLLPEDSIADLSCIQADVSVCTQLKPTNK